MTHRWTIYVCTICGKATDDTRDACRCPMSSADGVEVIPAKPVTMTPEQRFAAVDAGTLAISRKFILGVEGGALKWHPDVTPAALARTVLDALTEEFHDCCPSFVVAPCRSCASCGRELSAVRLELQAAVRERDQYRDALEFIARTDPVDNALDPDRNVRVARAALSRERKDTDA